MVSIVIVLAAVGALTCGFWVIAKRFAEGELSFWNLLGVVFVAKAAGKLVTRLTPGVDVPTQLAIAAACYILVMTLGLNVLGKIRLIPAILLSIGFTIAAVAVTMVLVIAVIPDKKRAAATPPAAAGAPGASGSASGPGK